MIKIVEYPDHERDRLELIAIAHHMKSIHPGASLDTGSGDTWTSPKNMHRWLSEQMSRFTSFLHTMTDRSSLEVWFNIIGNEGMIDWHNHLNRISRVKSGVYYVTGGTIMLKDVGKFEMAAGTVLMFPGDQLHAVPNEVRTKDRITLAFNAL